MNTNPYSGKHLRRNAWQFLTGKAASALLTFLILLWLVRLLKVDEYGVYVTLVAEMELGIALAGIGLSWLSGRYLPEYRLHAPGRALAKLCYQLLLWQALALLTFIALLFALLDNYLTWAELTRFYTPTLVYLGVLLIEGLGRFLREALLVPLTLQGAARWSMILRQSCFLSLIAGLDHLGLSTLLPIVWMELAASMLGLILAFGLLRRHLNSLYAGTGQLNWLPPPLSAQWRVAIRMYLNHLLTLTYSPQVFTTLIQYTVGLEAAALFGFLRNLQEQAGRYLPSTLMLSIIMPKLVASFVSGGGPAELNRNANLAGKLSLFTLMPLVALSALAGDPLVSLLSGGRFTNSGWLLLGFMVALIPLSQRVLIESVAVISGHANLCVWAATSGLLILPCWFLFDWGKSVWMPIGAIGLGHLLFNIIVVANLSKRIKYKIDWAGLSKLTVSTLVAYSAAVWLPLNDIADLWEIAKIPWIALMLQCLLTVSVYLLFAWWVKPFASVERSRINTLANRRVFVW
ncbi:MAG: hypothetical protein Q7U38_05970 [Methylobacter sp.]|nr:hypothetical protein [Methylobacter sp.]